MKAAQGKDIAKPSTIAIPWIYVPMASKLEAAPLKQSRHNGIISWNDAILSDVLLMPLPCRSN